MQQFIHPRPAIHTYSFLIQLSKQYCSLNLIFRWYSFSHEFINSHIQFNDPTRLGCPTNFISENQKQLKSCLHVALSETRLIEVKIVFKKQAKEVTKCNTSLASKRSLASTEAHVTLCCFFYLVSSIITLICLVSLIFLLTYLQSNTRTCT